MQLSSAQLRTQAGSPRDKAWLEAYPRALAAAVQTGDHVLDVSGDCGVLGTLALGRGAAHVTRVGMGPMLDLARLVHIAQGTSRQATFVRGKAPPSGVPRQVQVVLAGEPRLGGVGDCSWTALREIVSRHLASGGRVLPQRVTWWVAPAEVTRLRREVTGWEGRPAGLDLACVAGLLLGAPDLGAAPEEARLLGTGSPILELDLTRLDTDYHVGTARVEISAPGRLDAVAAWYVADLGAAVTITSDPRAPGRVLGHLPLLPVGEAPQVAPGERLTVEVRIDGRSELRAWTVARAGAAAFRFAHSTAESLLLTKEDLHKPLGE